MKVINTLKNYPRLFQNQFLKFKNCTFTYQAELDPNKQFLHFSSSPRAVQFSIDLDKDSAADITPVDLTEIEGLIGNFE